MYVSISVVRALSAGGGGGGGVNTMLAKHTTEKYRLIIECNRNLYKQEVLRVGPINYRDRNNI